MGLKIHLCLAKSLLKEKEMKPGRNLLKVASAVLGYEVSKDALLVANSGRYEFRNKGIDLFIDSLGELEQKYR